jgi:hypothetical protein
MTPVLSRAEARLLEVFRFAVGAEAAIDVPSLLSRETTPPRALGPSAQRLLHETLASGVVRALGVSGGWRQFGGRRLWERSAAPSLRFTGNVVRLGQWLLTGKPETPLAFDQPPTPAEDFLLALLVRRLATVGLESAVLTQDSVVALPLTQAVHHRSMLAQSAILPAVRLTPEHGPFIEGLATTLTHTWLATEHTKRLTAAPKALTALGDAQGALLDACLECFSALEQQRVMTWFVDFGARWLSEARSAADYGGALDSGAPLRERRTARLASASTVRRWVHLRTWREAHRHLRFIDDGYDEAQRLLVSWDSLGDRGFEAAQVLLSAVEGL